jgi:small-conductance mechanosensitive channel
VTGLRLFGWLLLGYGALIVATVATGFLGEAVRLSASIVWGLVVVVVVVYLVWRRRRSSV